MNATVTLLSDGSLFELDDRDIEEVSGGIGFVAAMAAASVVVGTLYAAEQLGEKIGEAVYYATH